MIWLPFQALQLFCKRPRLFVLGVFPGVFTFATSCGAVYGAWVFFLQDQKFWIALPAMILLFLVSWLLLGNLALLPVEDALVDECQRALWGEVRLQAPRFGLKRLVREIYYSLFLAAMILLLVLLTFLPLLAPLQFLIAAWISAYGFLSAIYARRVSTVSERLALFFQHPVSNFFLGALLNLLLFVPVLNVFLLGYAQVLAALVYFHRENRGA